MCGNGRRNGRGSRRRKWQSGARRQGVCGGGGWVREFGGACAGKVAGEHIGECVKIDGLGKIIIHPGGEAIVAVAFHSVGGEGDDGDVRCRAAVLRGGLFQAADLAGGFEAVHFGHLAVHEDQVVARAAEGGEHFAATGGEVIGVAGGGEGFGDDELIHLIVLGNEDVAAAGGPEFAGRRSEWLGRGRSGEESGGEPEGGAFAGGAGDADLAAHEFGELFADGQAQAGAAVFAGGGGIDLGEGLEEPADAVGGDSDAGVGNFEADEGGVGEIFFEGSGDGNMAGLGELDGVVHEVKEDLLEALGIAAEMGGERRLDAEFEFKGFGAGLGREDIEHILDGSTEFEVDGFEVQLAGLNFGEIEDVVDVASEHFSGGLEHVDVACSCLVESSVWRSSSAMPRTPFKGVRISWLMLARKWLLASLAARDSSTWSSSSRRERSFSTMSLKALASSPSSPVVFVAEMDTERSPAETFRTASRNDCTGRVMVELKMKLVTAAAASAMNAMNPRSPQSEFWMDCASARLAWISVPPTVVLEEGSIKGSNEER